MTTVTQISDHPRFNPVPWPCQECDSITGGHAATCSRYHAALAALAAPPAPAAKERPTREQAIKRIKVAWCCRAYLWAGMTEAEAIAEYERGRA